jgi:hypothetical protein
MSINRPSGAMESVPFQITALKRKPGWFAIEGEEVRFINLDEESKSNHVLQLLTAPLPPSAIVETGKAIQAFWYATPSETLDPEDYHLTNLHLACAFGGEVSSDEALHVPGLMDYDDPHNPFYVLKLYADLDARYGTEEIRRTYPLPDDVSTPQSRKSHRPSSNGSVDGLAEAGAVRVTGPAGVRPGEETRVSVTGAAILHPGHFSASE